MAPVYARRVFGERARPGNAPPVRPRLSTCHPRWASQTVTGVPARPPASARKHGRAAYRRAPLADAMCPRRLPLTPGLWWQSSTFSLNPPRLPVHRCRPDGADSAIIAAGLPWWRASIALPTPTSASLTSQGTRGVPARCANGPSVSVRTLSGGIQDARPRPFSPRSIAGPTLNQQPISIARSSSACVPENQCITGTPDPGVRLLILQETGRAGAPRLPSWNTVRG